MGPHTSDENHIRDVFKQSNECRTYLSTFTKQALQLSMGMSSDYEIAVEEGSDMVRIGSKLFD